MKTIGLIACSSTKQSGTHRAADLYTSHLFRLSRAWVEHHCPDGWYILSAKHHLLHPDAQVVSYDQALRDLPAVQRALWNRAVAQQLETLMPCRFIVLAGELYRQALTGLTYDTPLKGLGIGRQLQWLKSNTDTLAIAGTTCSLNTEPTTQRAI